MTNLKKFKIDFEKPYFCREVGINCARGTCSEIWFYCHKACWCEKPEVLMTINDKPTKDWTCQHCKLTVPFARREKASKCHQYTRINGKFYESK